MTEKAEHPRLEIDRRTFRTGQVMATESIHLTGGMQAVQVDGSWSMRPMSAANRLVASQPISRAEVIRFAARAILEIIGSDQVSGIGGPLPTRIWNPLYGPTLNGLPPAAAWGAIAISASRSSDERMSHIARKLAVTLNATSFRIRDASDCYHAQLVAALIDSRRPGTRFKNVPLMDLYLAIHSLLSEMASTRDYLAELAGYQLGAPHKIDALNRFEEWISAASRIDKATNPLAMRLLGSRNAGSVNRWLADLTDYRNEFLHRTPLGATRSGNSLVVAERHVDENSIRIIQLPITDLSADGAPGDALSILVRLHEKLLDLAGFAAERTGYSTAPPEFVVRP